MTLFEMSVTAHMSHFSGHVVTEVLVANVAAHQVGWESVVLVHRVGQKCVSRRPGEITMCHYISPSEMTRFSSENV